MAILLVMFPPETDISVCIWLLVLAGLAIYPSLHLFDYTLGTSKTVTLVFGILLVVIFTAGVGYKIWPELRPLRDLSNHQLKERVYSFAGDLNHFETRFETAMMDPNNSTKRTQISRDFTDQFNTSYRPVGMALRSDLLRRLGIPDEPLDYKHLHDLKDDREAPLAGIVAGANPYSRLAAYFQQLANQLPD